MQKEPGPPGTPMERVMVGIWSRALGVQRIGLHDDFFQLGGNDELAGQVISEVNDLFLVQLPPGTLHEKRTIARLISSLEAARGETRRTEAAIPKVGPLSFGQERLWILDEFVQEAPVYNEGFALRIKRALDISAVERSLNEIVRRHDSLRTTFCLMNGKPVQSILPHTPFELSPLDLPQDPGVDQESYALTLARETISRPYDLASGPMFRFQLMRLNPRDHLLVVGMHHIVTDDWSLGVFFRELSLLYEAFTSGNPSPLPDLPIQYADFAVRQREHLQGEVLAQELEYWKQQLQQLTVLELPADRPRPPALTYRGASQVFVLPSPLVQSLNALSRRERVTPFMTFLAAFETLLFRYCGQEDIAVGSPIASRTRAEIEGLMGFFVNTLVLRTSLAGNPTFRELLARVRDVALEAYEHQDLPFEKLVEELNPQRDPSRSPLFQVMLVLQNASETPPTLPGLAVEFLKLVTDTAKFDLTLELTENAGELRGTFEYSTDLFDKSTIDRMIGHFRTLLEGIVANPDQRLSELPLLTPVERHQLLVEWNRTNVDYPMDACIHQLFEAQVECTPDAVALVCEDRKLTYSELNRRANQLAHYLTKLGVGPDVLVGICVERSIEMVAGILAILKAGGAYVPLDPAYPKERLAFTLEDAAVKVLLTQRRLLDMLPKTQCEPVCLDEDWAMFAREAETTPAGVVTPGNLSYVIYTSGSTGKPKGVAIEHRNTVAFLNWARDVFPAPDLAGLLAGTTICFDLSVFELFLPLVSGGKIILAQNAVALPAPDPSHAVTLINTVPSVMAELMQSFGIPESVRTVNLAGEPLPQVLVDRIYRDSRVQRVYDLYGPTETTTYSTFVLRTQGGSQTVGRPIANTRIYILDRHRNPVPVGIHGEIYIGGNGVARGYLNRPELTAERFIPDPFSAQQGARLYRTGDLARYRPDGNIELLGRIDHQVKLRGFRIELGEIESVLGRHPDVRETAVLVRGDSPGDKRLVAYVVAKSGGVATAGELRRFLQQKLPDYMVPSVFVLLDAMPLAPGGKLDRRALPAPYRASGQPEESYAAPHTPTEKALAGIWAEVLGVKRVGIRDNFFELGGHSLLATRVMSQVRSTFGVNLALRRMFDAPTVADLAGILEPLLDKADKDKD